MKKDSFRRIIRIILTALVIVNVETAAIELPSNFINSSTSVLTLKHWQIIKDTDPKSTIPDFPDSLWQLLDSVIDEDLYAEGNWILRTNISISDSVSDKIIWGLFPLNLITAYELYWDGIKIGENGITGTNKENEKTGKFNFNIGLSPDLLTSGNHTIILRISNHHSYSPWKWFYGDLVLGHYESVLEKKFQSGFHAFFISGILFISFLFNLFLYINRQRNTEHLLFSLICFLVILDFLSIQAPLIFNFPATYIHFEYYFYQINTMTVTILFPAFFIYSFSLTKKTIGIVVVINLIIYLFFIDIWNIFEVLSLSVLIVSSALAIWALKLRREGSIIISAGLILSWAAYFFNFAFEGLAAIMVVCTSFFIAQQFARKETAGKAAELKSAHLENELLKKNISPHFVLNTLTSIIVWLRKDSGSAIKLIEALAEEFRMINQISALKQIPICQEINLCKAHIKIMSFRKGADYKLETLNMNEQDTVPPMIFHTLVENGLTHGYENKINGTFTLQRIKKPDCVQYIFSNDGEFNSEESKNSTGFGLRYIQGRLEESYPGRWIVNSNKSALGWETVIEIKD